MYLALALRDDGENWSIGVNSLDHKIVEEKLTEHQGISPHEIFLIENGIEGPEVVEHWYVGETY